MGKHHGVLVNENNSFKLDKQEFLLVMKHKVTVKFGPYVSCGLLEHRTARLEGMQELLRSNDHSVEFVKIPDRDQVELVVHGEVVYQCKIQDLQYGGDGKLDPVCHAALEAVNKAY